MNNIVTGAATYNPVTNSFDTTGIVITVNPSVLLQRDASYTIVYGLLSDQSFTYLGQELPVSYLGEAFNGNGGLNQVLTPNDLFDGTFILVGFIARVTNDGYIRVSNVAVIPFEAFAEVNEAETINGFALEVKVTFNDGLLLSLNSRDEQAPEVTLDLFEEETVLVFSGDLETNVVNIELTSSDAFTLADALNALSISDNSNEFIKVELENITFNGESVSAFDQTLSVGTYVITISDSSDNVTKVTFVISLND